MQALSTQALKRRTLYIMVYCNHGTQREQQTHTGHNGEQAQP